MAEKPSVAREIAAALGGFSKHPGGWLESDRAVITSGIGHLVEICVPEAETSGKDLASLPVIPQQFSLRPIVSTKAQYSLVAKLMKRADISEVVNACDAGREGELIFRLTYEHCGCKKTMRRMWLQSMTNEAIREAFQSMRPGSQFDDLANAARSRAEADWLIGINASRAATRLHEHNTGRYESMSAGRVQTPTLAILVHRAREIQTFVPRDYYEVHATFRAQSGTYVGKWAPTEEASDNEEGGRLWDEARAQAIVARCRGVAPSSVQDESKTVTSQPPKLFDLTTLQREANKKFRFSAKKTLDLAQALYEQHKALSYPRTDASALPEDYLDKSAEILASFRGSAYATHAARALDNGWVRPNKRVFDNSKISDHFAIIPTGVRPTNLSEEEGRLYDLVVRRFISIFYPAAEYRQTRRVTLVAGETFRSSGRVLVNPGWLEVYGQQADGEKTPALCIVQSGEAVQNEAVEVETLQTKPPSHFTEASLLAAMEGAGKLVDDDALADAMKERGLGTPATRASIIEGLLSVKGAGGRAKEPYVVRQGKEQHLVPTAKGVDFIGFLEQVGIGALASPAMTGEWEQRLRQVEQGKLGRQDFMGSINAQTREMIEAIRGKVEKMPGVTHKPVGAACPKCGSDVLAKLRTFECERACGFKLWREVFNRELSDEEASKLISSGRIGPLEGFRSRQGKSFGAELRLDTETGKVEPVFGDNAPLGTLPDLGVPCPRCGGTLRCSGGEYPKAVCENQQRCGFSLSFVIAGLLLSTAQARELLTKGRLPPMHGFKSRQKKPFAAGLHLDESGNVKFEFGD